jgi:hypothetical protein
MSPEEEAAQFTASEADLLRSPDPAKELIITDRSVIEAPEETTFDPSHPSGATKQGAWSFGRLIHNMLPPADRDDSAKASQLALNWLKTWETNQSPNTAVSPAKARLAIRTVAIEPWKLASGCTADESSDATCVLDMSKAPFRLMAIANRPDLRIVSEDGTAIGGEGRFVFQLIGPTLGRLSAGGPVGIVDATPRPQKFTVIFEYSLPVHDNAETIVWARRWHLLGAVPFGPGYNAMLRSITNGFAGADADPRRANGNALNQLRTNEVATLGRRAFNADGTANASLSVPQFWELREFRLATDGLQPHTMNLEPARDLDIPRALFTDLEGTRTAELSAYLAANADDVLASKNRIPADLVANSSLVGSAPYGAWGKVTNTVPGSTHALTGVSIPVRDQFALNTCAGCHRHETDTRHFMHITDVRAMDNVDKAAVGVNASTPSDAIVLSNFLNAEIAIGGPRNEDFAKLLVTPVWELKNRPGLRVCGN